MQKTGQITIEKLTPPYRNVDVEVQPDQIQFIDPVDKALSILTPSELAFVVQCNGKDVGFFTLRPSENDEVEQLRGANYCTLRSFMIDAREQGKGFASKALLQLPRLIGEHMSGIVRVGLTVNCRNKAAYALYKKCGFSDLGELYLGGSAGPQHIMNMDLG